MFAKLLIAATAGAILLTSPVSVIIADAAKIKVQVKTVTIKPKVAVIKPKVAITKAKPRIKVKQKIAIARPKAVKPAKIVIAKPKIASKAVTMKPVVKIKPVPAVKLQAKTAFTVKPASKVTAPKKPIRLAKQTKTNSVPAAKLATIKLEAPKRKLAFIPESALPAPEKRPSLKTTNVGLATTPVAETSVPQGASSEAAAAAKAAAEIAALAKQGMGHAGSSASLLKEVQGLSSSAPKGNRDILQGMQREHKGPASGAFTPGSNWTNNAPGGFGPDQFAGLPNTHRQAPANAGNAGQAAQDFWSGQMSGSINGARDGVASQGPVRTVRLAQDNPSHPVPGYHTDESIDYYADGSRVHNFDVTYPNGTHSHSAVAYDANGRMMWRSYDPSPTSSERFRFESFDEPAGPGPAPSEKASAGEPPKPQQDDGKPGVNPTKLYAPDFTEGGPTPFPWIEEGGTFDFRTAGGKTPGAMPQGPDEARPQAVPTASAMTANDLLERYDPDNQNRGGGRTLRREDVCFHSEC